MAGRRVPHKLERYLMTIARRRSIQNIFVALIVFFDGGILISDSNDLPCRRVDAQGMDCALKSLMESIGLKSSTRYLGYADDGKGGRKYIFASKPDERPIQRTGRIVDAQHAGSVLCRREARLLEHPFMKPAALHHAVDW